MRTFEFTRASDPAAAVRAGAQAKTAQQGADVRFLAGGTTLLDLMKLNVETPARLVDIMRCSAPPGPPLRATSISPSPRTTHTSTKIRVVMRGGNLPGRAARDAAGSSSPP